MFYQTHRLFTVEEGFLEGEFDELVESSFEDTLFVDDIEEWRKTIRHDVNEKYTFEVFDHPDDRNVIGCRMTLEKGFDVDGKPETGKVYLLAKGYTECPDIDNLVHFSKSRLSIFVKNTVHTELQI